MDMIPHSKGMVGVKDPVQAVSIVMDNKQVKYSAAIRAIPGVTCDTQGNQIVPVRMTNIPPK